MGKIKSLVTKLVGDVKTYWNKPREGEYLSIKEFASYCIGSMGICGFSFICGETAITFAAGYFCGSIMGISLLDFSIISIIAVIVRYCTLFVESLNMTVFENLGNVTKKTAKKCTFAYSLIIVIGIALYFVPSEPFEGIIKGLPQLVANILVVSGVGSFVNWFVRKKLCGKYGRYKPFMMIYGVPIAILSCLIPFVPASLDYTTKLVILHLLFTVRGRFTALFQDCSQTVVAVVTPNTVERQKLYSIGGIFLGFLRSIYRILFPVMIILTGGYLNVLSYKVFVPVLSIISLVMGLFFSKVKERVIEPVKDKPKVDFRKSAKALLKNKFFWITNVSGIFGSLTGLADGVMNYFLIYNLRLEWIMGFVTIAGVTSVIGNLFTPVLIKKFEKRTLILTLRSVWIAITACYLLAISWNSIFLLLLFTAIRSAVSACSNGINMSLQADILDYHQCQTGERADSMSGIFGWFTTPLTTAVGLAIPFVMKRYGFTSDWDVLFDSTVFDKVMIAYIIAAIAGLILTTLPFIFYNLTRAQHDQCVAELKRRAAIASGEPLPEELACEVASAEYTEGFIAELEKQEEEL